MVKRRAVARQDKDLQPEKLPTLYKTLIPLTAERHGSYFLAAERIYDYAKEANAIPITADEFAQVARHYPIVLAGAKDPTPVALVGYTAGRNDHVDAEGNWTQGTYIPAYLRRYPFCYVREGAEADRNILCADLSSIIFDTKGEADRALFTDGEPGPLLKNVMDFCNRYEVAVARTRAAIQEAVALDLVEPSTVTITAKGKSVKVEGFQIISEEKIRKLSDSDLAGLARRGVLNIFAAHHMSLTNFSSLGQGL
ncbi:MAG: SapC family protein [Pseudomonadota bacterium]